VGIEMAAEIAMVYPDLKVTLVHSRDRLLSAEPLPDDFKDQTVELLENQRVEVVLGKRVKETKSTGTQESPSYEIVLSDGSTMTAGHVIFAVSRQTPISSYFPVEALSEDGYVKVSQT
jgi:NADH dehydrogenase FAD-containing subunit